jgi:hypothetical protein
MSAKGKQFAKYGGSNILVKDLGNHCRLTRKHEATRIAGVVIRARSRHDAATNTAARTAKAGVVPSASAHFSQFGLPVSVVAVCYNGTRILTTHSRVSKQIINQKSRFQHVDKANQPLTSKRTVSSLLEIATQRDFVQLD